MKITEATFRSLMKSDRLCVINAGKAYDVTDFAGRHPGGRELLENHVGQDVTDLMKTHDTHIHSTAAYSILDKYYIGHLPAAKGVVHRTGKPGISCDQNQNGVMADDKLSEVQAEVDDYDKVIDMTKPVFWQVGNLGDRYFSWVHSPIDSPLRLFQSDLCETLSQSFWWLVLLYWVPVSSAILWYAYTQFQAQTVYWSIPWIGAVEVPIECFPLLFVLGLLMWTFDEYVVHRWLFHCQPPGWSKALITLHFLFHGQHHKSPMDKTRLVFPPIPATMLGLLIYNIYKLLAPPVIAQVLFSGTIVGYLCYDLIHYYLHHGNPSLNYFKELKTYHVKHHFKDQQKGFGISSKLWDYPFRTLLK